MVVQVSERNLCSPHSELIVVIPFHDHKDVWDLSQASAEILEGRSVKEGATGTNGCPRRNRFPVGFGRGSRASPGNLDGF